MKYLHLFTKNVLSVITLVSMVSLPVLLLPSSHTSPCQPMESETNTAPTTWPCCLHSNSSTWQKPAGISYNTSRVNRTQWQPIGMHYCHLWLLYKYHSTFIHIRLFWQHPFYRAGTAMWCLTYVSGFHTEGDGEHWDPLLPPKIW